MIRLVFISTLVYNYFFPGQIKQAGGHTRIYNLARAFSKIKGYEVFCITGDFGQDEVIEKDGVTLIKVPVDNPRAFSKVWAALKALKPDILIDFCASPRLFLYALLKMVTSMKVVFLTCCDNDVNGDYRKAENFIFHFLYIQGLKAADRIVAQVPKHQQLLMQNYHLDSELVLSPYFKIEKTQPSRKDVVLWVGRAAYYKRPEIFLKLAKGFPDQKFVMICNASGYDTGFMAEIDYGKQVPDNLEFYDYVPYPEMEKFYSRAKFLINTSDYEGFSNTFIEAAVNYTPILSLNSDPNEMLSLHGAGFHCKGNLKLLDIKCRQMLQNDEKIKEAGRHAFAYAFKFHRLEVAARQFDTIFKSMIKKGGP